MQQSDLLQAAQYYAKRPWPVLPIKPGEKTPLTAHGLKDASTNESTIVRWWDQYPDANIGIATGKSAGIWVLDIDGEIGSQSLTALEKELGPLPDTLEQKTGGGGRQLFFRWPDKREIRNKQSVRPGIDVRGEGGYVVVPPSLHPSGQRYEWPYGDSTKIADAPKAWLDLVAPLPRRRMPWDRKAPVAAAPPPAPAGIVQAPVIKRAKLYLAECEPAEQGSGGHNALLWAARAMVVGFQLDDRTALDLLWAEFNPRCVPPWDRASEKDVKDFDRKVVEARRTSSKKPAGWLLDEYGLRDNVNAMAQIAQGRQSQINLLASAKAPEPVDDGETMVGSEKTCESVATVSASKGKSLVQRLGTGEMRSTVPMRIPGFISEVMDLCLETAPYPNEPLAFAGALALQSFLAGRKVRDTSDVRPNLYLLGLAPSGCGKEHPRKVIKQIAFRAGLAGGVADSIASAEGLEDALYTERSMLLLLDEMDAVLRAIGGARAEQRYIELQRALLTLYSASSSVYKMRLLAGGAAGTINEPSLAIFGTAIPLHFFSALSELMLTNGLTGRMLVIDARGPRIGQCGRIIKPSDRIIEAATWWKEFSPGGNLGFMNPVPMVIPSERKAESLLQDFRMECDERYNAAGTDEEAERTIHARTCEMARKVVLIYAVSEGQDRATISVQAAKWAIDFARQQAGQMLGLIKRYGAGSPFEQGCQRIREILQRAPQRCVQRSVLLKRMKLPAKDFDQLMNTLIQRDEVDVKTTRTPGRAAHFFHLRG